MWLEMAKEPLQLACKDLKDLAPSTAHLPKIESKKPFKTCLSTSIDFAIQATLQQCSLYLNELLALTPEKDSEPN